MPGKTKGFASAHPLYWSWLQFLCTAYCVIKRCCLIQVNCSLLIPFIRGTYIIDIIIASAIFSLRCGHLLFRVYSFHFWVSRNYNNRLHSLSSSAHRRHLPFSVPLPPPLPSTLRYTSRFTAWMILYRFFLSECYRVCKLAAFLCMKP